MSENVVDFEAIRYWRNLSDRQLKNFLWWTRFEVGFLAGEGKEPDDEFYEFERRCWAEIRRRASQGNEKAREMMA